MKEGDEKLQRVAVLMMHMKMKGEEKDERGYWPKEAYEAFTAYGSPCTPVYLHSFMHTRHAVTVIEAQADAHIFAPFIQFMGRMTSESKGITRHNPLC